MFTKLIAFDPEGIAYMHIHIHEKHKRQGGKRGEAMSAAELHDNSLRAIHAVTAAGFEIKVVLFLIATMITLIIK